MIPARKRVLVHFGNIVQMKLMSAGFVRNQMWVLIFKTTFAPGERMTLSLCYVNIAKYYTELHG